jgi:hypothetical protein
MGTHNPSHPITTVEYVGFVGFVGCIWSFYPGVDQILFPHPATYLPGNFGDFFITSL